MKKVLIITYYWPPSGGAGVQRWVKFAKYLRRLDIEPIILTVHPDFATYPQKDFSLKNDIPQNILVYYTKSFELYSLYKKLSPNKEVPYGGFSNTEKLSYKEKLIRFIRGNFIIPDPRKGWNRYALTKAKKLIHSFQIDTVITTSPPHSTQLIGLKLKKQLKINWIADLRDPWIDIYYFKQMYPTFLATQVHKRMEKKVLNNADKIITVSNELKKLFASKTNNISDKIKIITNGFDADDFKNVEISQCSDKFVISYVGTISKEYNIKGFIKGIYSLPEEIKSIITLRFIGKMPSELFIQFKEAGLSNLLENTGYVPHHNAIDYMFSSDLLLLVIPDVSNNEGILTGKIFEYLASQNPILMIGPKDGDAAKLIRETASGFIYDYNEQEKISECIRILINNKKDKLTHTRNEKEVMKYSRQKLSEQLLTIINSF